MTLMTVIITPDGWAGRDASKHLHAVLSADLQGTYHNESP
jgi:hypothetical protein